MPPQEGRVSSDSLEFLWDSGTKMVFRTVSSGSGIQTGETVKLTASPDFTHFPLQQFLRTVSAAVLGVHQNAADLLLHSLAAGLAAFGPRRPGSCFAVHNFSVGSFHRARIRPGLNITVKIKSKRFFLPIIPL